MSDHYLFHKIEGGKMTLLVVYVNDILIRGDDSAMVDNLIFILNSKFALKHLGLVTYFLGIESRSTCSSIFLNQSKYIWDLLIQIDLDHSNSYSTPSCPSLKTMLVAVGIYKYITE